MNHKLKISFQKELKKFSHVQIIGPMPIEKYFIDEQNPMIYVDGGIKFQKNFPSKNHFSLGDQDSTRKKLDLVVSPYKDFSDLAMALELVGKRCQLLFLDGFFPDLKKELRFDHLLANLGTCYEWSDRHSGFIQLNSKCFILPKGTHKIELSGHFSLFSLKKIQLKLVGKCQYQLKKKITLKPLSSHGLSNIGSGIIQIENTGPVIFIPN